MCICHVLHKNATARERVAVSSCARLKTPPPASLLTVLVAGVGAGALQSVEVLREHGQVGLGGALIVLWVRRLLHHLLDLLDHLSNTSDTNGLRHRAFLRGALRVLSPGFAERNRVFHATLRLSCHWSDQSGCLS